jgi:AcrR family transcriptional regulator
MSDAKPKGRPVAADATPKALKAALNILLTEGYAKLSIERVAQITGLGKPTLYRRWPNAGALALQALLTKAPKPSAFKGAPEAALQAHLAASIAAFDSAWGRQSLQVLAATDPGLPARQGFVEALFLAPRQTAAELLSAAMLREDLAAPPDLPLLVEMLYAPIQSAVLLSQPMPDPAALVRTALLACAKDSPRRAKPAPAKAILTIPADLTDLIEEPRQFSLF